jgi:undecaprenyl-diphosphatase
MFAASAWKVYKLIAQPEGIQILVDNMTILLIGNLVAFIVAIAAIRFFIGYVTKYGFKTFGIYRIIAGSLIIILLLAGYNLEIIS